MSLPTKRCAGGCGLTLPFGPVSEGGKFHRDNGSVDGHQSSCIDCQRTKQRARRIAIAAGRAASVLSPVSGQSIFPDSERLRAVADLGAKLAYLETSLAPSAANDAPVFVPGVDDGFEIADPSAIAKRAKAEADRERREASDFEALRPGDFESGVGRGDSDPRADKEKKQEYAKQMGELAEMLRDPGTATPEAQTQLAGYVARLAEEERRFRNRRLARSVSLAAANEALFVRQFRQAAAEHLSGKIEATGFATKPSPNRPPKRTVNILLSDLHFGSDLGKRENPEPFGAEEESRRFAKIVLEVANYKTQHRDHSSLNVLLNGDIIEGFLGHDLRSGAPLTEQFIATWKYLSAALAHWSAVFPSVHVECQAGNHGRRIEKAPGRDVGSTRWDSHEHNLYWGLQAMCSGLQNVTFSIPMRAVSILNIHGSRALLAHGDGEPRVKHPDSGARANAEMLNTINATRLYGDEVQLACFGHWHTPRLCYFKGTTAIFNGALVPPSGYARAAGFVGEKCGQFMFESVEGYPCGDVRFLEVGPSEDRDASLNRVVAPFRFAA